MTTRLAIAACLVVLLPHVLMAQTATPVGSGSRFAWDAAATSQADAQAKVYKSYKDGGNGVAIVGVVCHAATATSPAGTVPCDAPFAAETPGVSHSFVITAQGPGELESPPSNALSYTYTVQTIAPKNVRKQ
jgi:hypothetical protein